MNISLIIHHKLMKPITKFLITTIDEIIIFAIILYFAIIYLPEYSLYIAVGGSQLILLFTLIKYRIVKVALLDTHYSYDVVGKKGVVIKKISPVGKIRIANEIWTAFSDDQQEIDEGTTVVVVRREGHKLWVRKAEKSSIE